MRVVATLAMLFFVMAARASELKDFAGTWAMRIGERNLLVLTLNPKGNGFGGSFQRPARFSETNGTFANMSEQVRTYKVVHTSLKGGVLHFMAQNANDPKDEDAYAMTVNGDRAELAFDNLPPDAAGPAFALERAPATSKVATDWEPNRLYVPGEDSDVPNAEMKAIFAEDQRVRMTATIDWTVVGKTDEQRREQTRKLLAAGALHTGKDFEEAAFVFQHGDSPQDYLLAHTLAMVAVSKGDPTAIWIAAATLDRYLERVGQSQVYGTQYSRDAKSHWTQEPYDRGLISDALRRDLGVPSQAAQSERLRAYQAQK